MSASLNNLFPDAFMQMHTKFKSIDELLDLSGYTYKTPEDFDKIIHGKSKQIDEYIRRETQFFSFINMMESALIWSDPHRKDV